MPDELGEFDITPPRAEPEPTRAERVYLVLAQVWAAAGLAGVAAYWIYRFAAAWQAAK